MMSGKVCIKRILPIISVLLVTIPIRLEAKTIIVGKESGDFRSIQRAVDIAAPGDTVLVKEGIYYEMVHLGKKHSGTKEKPIRIIADPKARPNSVIVDGTKEIPASAWTIFEDKNKKYGIYVKTIDNIWTTSHDPSAFAGKMLFSGDLQQRELLPSDYDGRYGTTLLLLDNAPATLVPDIGSGIAPKTRPYNLHLDLEATQKHEFINRNSPHFLRPMEWIWYDDGRSDGSDKDEEAVIHPEFIKNRIFLKLPEGSTPATTNIRIAVHNYGFFLDHTEYVEIKGITIRNIGLVGVRTSFAGNITLRGLHIYNTGFSRAMGKAGGGKQHQGTSQYVYAAIGGEGIVIHGYGHNIIEGCLIENVRTAGIYIWGRDLRKDMRKDKRKFMTGEIKHNHIHNVYTHPWGGWWAHGRGDLLWMRNCEEFIVRENIFEGSGLGLERDPGSIGRVGGNGIWLDGYARNNFILGNIVKNVYRTALFNEHKCKGNIWAFNIVMNARSGARFGPRSPHVRFLNNTIFDVKEGGLHFDFNPRRVRNRIGTDKHGAFMNNIVYAFEKGAIWRELYSRQKGVFVNYNLYYTPEKDIHSPGTFSFEGKELSGKDYISLLKASMVIEAESKSIFFEDPRFNDISQKDFSLSSNSPAINSGISFDHMEKLGIINRFEKVVLEKFSPAFENRDIGAVEWTPSKKEAGLH